MAKHRTFQRRELPVRKLLASKLLEVLPLLTLNTSLRSHFIGQAIGGNLVVIQPSFTPRLVPIWGNPIDNRYVFDVGIQVLGKVLFGLEL